MVPSYAFAFDYGNADTCGVVVENGMKRFQVIPSATGKGSLTSLANKRGAKGDTYERDSHALEAKELVIQVNGMELYVGDMALKELRASHTGHGDVTRYWNPKALAVLLALSGKMLEAPDYELHVVTGLPIGTFSKENRDKVRAALEGEHTFILNGRKRRALIHVSRVVMEGAGAMIAYGKNEEVLQGVIDIGGRTTDLYASQNQRTIADRCAGEPLGVEQVTQIVNEKFAATYGRELSLMERRQMIRAFLGEHAYPPLQTYGVQPDREALQHWIETAISTIADEIVGFISRTWNSSEQGAIAAEMAPVLLIGGGAYYFQHLLKKRIPHLMVPSRPETANAEGYITLAHVLLSRTKAIA